MIVLDGPMGTELAARGVPTPAPGWSAHAVTSAPDVVRAIHADYAHAGATVHRTNTFRTQPRLFPETYRALARDAVRLAREGAGAGARIAGSLAPVFDCYRPDLSPPPHTARTAHAAMAAALEGVDLIVCETFPHAGEAVIAVEAARTSCGEVWAALTAGPDGTLMSPEAMERAARDCVAAGAKAVLVCCTGVAITGPYVARLARLGVPFGAYANAFDWSGDAAAYAAIAASWRALGATIVGGCCGTTPAHIALLASSVAEPQGGTP